MNLLGRQIGLDQPFFLIAGPCVVESEELQLRTAERLKEITDRLGVHFIFKSSFDKANRSSDRSYRGPGMDEGLRVLEKVRASVGVSGKPVNIKKAQFMAPHDMKNVVDKARRAAQAAGVNDETIMVCERGA